MVVNALCAIFLVCRAIVRVKKTAASAADFEESLINVFACVPRKIMVRRRLCAVRKKPPLLLQGNGGGVCL